MCRLNSRESHQTAHQFVCERCVTAQSTTCYLSAPARRAPDRSTPGPVDAGPRAHREPSATEGRRARCCLPPLWPDPRPTTPGLAPGISGGARRNATWQNRTRGGAAAAAPRKSRATCHHTHPGAPPRSTRAWVDGRFIHQAGINSSQKAPRGRGLWAVGVEEKEARWRSAGGRHSARFFWATF